MAYVKFKHPHEPSIKTLIPKGLKFKRWFMGLLIVFIIENGILVYILLKH